MSSFCALPNIYFYKGMENSGSVVLCIGVNEGAQAKENFVNLSLVLCFSSSCLTIDGCLQL